MALGDFFAKKLKEEKPVVQQVIVQQVLGPEQLPNILKNAVTTLNAGDGKGAGNLFTQALSINPESALALAGRGASSIIQCGYTVGAIEKTGNEALTYWKNAQTKPDFDDEAIGLIGNSVIVFVRRAHKESQEEFNKMKREVGGTTNKVGGRGVVTVARNLAADDLPFVKERQAEEEALENFMDKVLELNSILSCMPLLEAIRNELSDAVSFSARTKAGAALFSNKHQYSRLFAPARTIFEGRNDWHGKYKVTQTSGLVKFAGAITVSNDTKKKYKIKKIPIAFYTKGQKSFCFEIRKKQQVLVGTSRAAQLAEQCKAFSVWNVSAKKKKLLLVCTRLFKDDELAGQMPEIANMIDTAVSEGKQICEMIMASGGKLGFFAGLTAK
ncbi:hypothetical protein FACS1894142_6640 [Spirochaetia bacterium]|nr:hypothetical protein FACS1894142_6640 [Spirochaetia bacterium]